MRSYQANSCKMPYESTWSESLSILLRQKSRGTEIGWGSRLLDASGLCIKHSLIWFATCSVGCYCIKSCAMDSHHPSSSIPKNAHVCVFINNARSWIIITAEYCGVLNNTQRGKARIWIADNISWSNSDTKSCHHRGHEKKTHTKLVLAARI